MRLDLMQILYALADAWIVENGKAGTTKPVTLATLGARVHKDAKLFERLEQGGSLSVLRYEKLVEYLADPENWPGWELPEHVRATLHRLAIIQPGERLVVERDTVERKTISGS